MLANLRKRKAERAYKRRVKQLRPGIKYEIHGPGIMRTTADEILKGAATEFEAAREMVNNGEEHIMKHQNYEEIKRYIEDVENHTVIAQAVNGWCEVEGCMLSYFDLNAKTVAKRHLQLALDYYNGKCPNGVEYLSAGTTWSVSNGKCPTFNNQVKYRKAERKLEEGHWYPVVDPCGNKRVMIFTRGYLTTWGPLSPSQFLPGSLKIGESLGCDLHGEGE